MMAIGAETQISGQVSGEQASRELETLSSLPDGTRLRPLEFHSLARWNEDGQKAAFETFLGTCRTLVAQKNALRAGRAPSAALLRICELALAVPPPETDSKARAFFETHFRALEVTPAEGKGFLTAYYEPELLASREKTPDYSEPVFGRPDDLVTILSGEAIPGLDPALAAARRVIKEGAKERFTPYPERSQLWAGAVPDLPVIAYLRDKADLFITQVQGSARMRFADGASARLIYAGRNGHPYTSIGRILVENGEIPITEMSLERLMAWLRADLRRGQVLMEKNKSFVFFAREDNPPDQGPIGGAGVPLTAGRSLAIDRTIWAYGLPVWIEASPLAPGGGRLALDRLMIAQDTGSAIVGAARGDFFMGTGASAGTKAGLVRDAMRFVILVPGNEADAKRRGLE